MQSDVKDADPLTIVLRIAGNTTFNMMFIYNSITHTDYLILYDIKDTF